MPHSTEINRPEKEGTTNSGTVKENGSFPIEEGVVHSQWSRGTSSRSPRPEVHQPKPRWMDRGADSRSQRILPWKVLPGRMFFSGKSMIRWLGMAADAGLWIGGPKRKPVGLAEVGPHGNVPDKDELPKNFVMIRLH